MIIITRATASFAFQRPYWISNVTGSSKRFISVSARTRALFRYRLRGRDGKVVSVSQKPTPVRRKTETLYGRSRFRAATDRGHQSKTVRACIFFTIVTRFLVFFAAHVRRVKVRHTVRYFGNGRSTKRPSGRFLFYPEQYTVVPIPRLRITRISASLSSNDGIFRGFPSCVPRESSVSFCTLSAVYRTYVW